ncbi:MULTISPECIES: GTP-binding protein [unclassified Methanoregula]|uniref:OBG GTPase family GTP-binding protein n=1 Tax=unclassified Methanoregula TaxID=2649730 RepID=UPI0009CD47F2|nr:MULTISPECIES: GTP-binding protein [unclassified Methanoregula]OPX65557.1 MAG: GTPase CgtA [Methanoregula sp. PtaB.Bin085]OPY35836.1 MAG: GTPase CgtA [Methanoregula sp. PtaU1.Bin006]
MSSLEEQIKELEDELVRTPYNKATSKHIGRVKAKIARLKDEAVNRAMKAGGGGEGYQVRKSGDATAVLVGFPSTGKSTLLNKLTGTDSAVGAYAFTTLTVVPGALEHKGAKIQLLDIPGLIAGAAMGKGRGKEVIAVVRNADIIIILVDVFNEQHFDVLLRELYDAGIRINVPKPDITIKKSSHGGIRLNAVGTLDLDIEEVRSILAESKMMNADILIRGNATQDDLIDAVQGNRMYIPAFIAVNKVDLVDKERYLEIEHDIGGRFGNPPIMISAAAGFHLEELKDALYDCLGFIRVYLKPHGGEADLEEPLIIRRGSTVEDICNKLHRDFAEKFRYARIWGKSVKHPGQRVGLTHTMTDGDLLTIIVER